MRGSLNRRLTILHYLSSARTYPRSMNTLATQTLRTISYMKRKPRRRTSRTTGHSDTPKSPPNTKKCPSSTPCSAEGEMIKMFKVTIEIGISIRTQMTKHMLMVTMSPLETTLSQQHSGLLASSKKSTLMRNKSPARVLSRAASAAWARPISTRGRVMTSLNSKSSRLCASSLTLKTTLSYMRK